MQRFALLLSLLLCVSAAAAPPDRITRRIDAQETSPLPTSVHRLAQPRYDQGAVEPDFRLDSILLIVKPSAAQQLDLRQLLTDLQNPSSPQFRRWLTPEQFGDRFGLNSSDHSKLAAWLGSQGFTIRESGRARNWIAFGGTAGQVRQALHTDIHRYRVNGQTHYANATAPSVPSALAEVVAGFSGLNDFIAQPPIEIVQPGDTVGSTHYLVPEDYGTLYDIAPLYAAGIDGTGVNIGIAGESTILLSDVEMFRSKYNLPANDPQLVLAGANPGVNGSWQTEGDLDVEWSGAVAPGAGIYFYYSTSITTSITMAVNANKVHIISISAAGSELDDSVLTYEPIYQQANAQGITLLAATGDWGASSPPDSGNGATRGPVVAWPSSYPEVTAVGGTQFNEGTGTYWATANSPNSGSALSYIPEIAWSDGGGGASLIFPKPAWQSGPGVPADGARDVPDISLSASTHDAYFIATMGLFEGVGGTSASTPSMAGIIALLNHYLVANGQISKPGLGNINPQLYRMAQNTPGAFHDITSGADTVTCEQASSGCQNGSFGYAAGPGYDMATGIGSVDANNFVTSWNSSVNAVNVSFTVTPAKATLNDTFQLVAIVTPASGSGTPTGMVDFSNGSIPLGSVTLDASSGQPTATLSISGWMLGTQNSFTLIAQYRGDTAFSGGGATAKLQTTAPTGVSSIVPSAPVTVAATPDVSGLFWQFSITLRERGGVDAILTEFDIDGQSQPLAQYFPNPEIPANSSVTSQLITLRSLPYPTAQTFGFSGIDASGQTWTRQVSLTFTGPRDVETVTLSAVPLIVPQNPSAACPYSQQIMISETSGYPQTISGLYQGNLSISGQINAIFGTDRLAAYRSLQGTFCWPNAVPGTSNTLDVIFASGIEQTITASFAGPLVNPAPVSASVAQGVVSISAPDGQPWTLSVFPQNLFTSWLQLSQTSGSGSAQVSYQTNAAQFEPGVYLATIVVQGPNLSPPAICLPVMFISGDTSQMTIAGMTNTASGQPAFAPGMTATLTGTALANVSVSASSAAFAYTVGGVTAAYALTVNGVPAAFKSLSPGKITFQIPYETGAGPAVVGINNLGSFGGYLFNVSPSAPAIYTDANGNVTPAATVQAGSALTITITGDGETSPSNLTDGATPASNSSLMWKPALPLSVTIGGAPAFVTSYGIASGAVGVTTVNMIVPSGTPPGPQPVVVTVGGVASPPANVTITAAQ